MGARRAHRCTCGTLTGTLALTAPGMCPACVVLAQLRLLNEMFATAPNIPLCPTLEGTVCLKAAVVGTIVHAASLLRMPSQAHSSAPSWGGHSLRRGGVQFLCNAGVGLDKIRTLARQSPTSNSIFKYTDGAHAVTTVHVAAEAAFANTVGALRCEVSSLRQALAASVLPSRESPSLTPPAGPQAPASVLPESLPYVRAMRANAPIHVKCSIQAGRIKCGWRWGQAQHVEQLAQPIFFHDEAADHMAPMCSRCRDALTASSDSASTD